MEGDSGRRRTPYPPRPRNSCTKESLGYTHRMANRPSSRVRTVSSNLEWDIYFVPPGDAHEKET